MKQFIEVTAMRIGAVIQNVCANVEFEVMSLPGGSLIAVLLCLYAIAMSSIRRAATEIRTSGIRPKPRGIAVGFHGLFTERSGSLSPPAVTAHTAPIAGHKSATRGASHLCC